MSRGPKPTSDAGKQLAALHRAGKLSTSPSGIEEVEGRIAAIELEVEARVPIPDWKRTKVTGRADEALAISVKPGSVVSTSEGSFVFEKAGDWLLLPAALWKRTLTRLRLAEARFAGKGDGGPRRVS